MGKRKQVVSLSTTGFSLAWLCRKVCSVPVSVSRLKLGGTESVVGRLFQARLETLDEMLALNAVLARRESSVRFLRGHLRAHIASNPTLNRDVNISCTRESAVT